MLHSSIAHSIICTRLFRGKMHSDWFNGIKILQGRWQHGEKVGYCYPSALEKTLCKWDMYVPLVTKELSYFPVDLCFRSLSAINPFPFIRLISDWLTLHALSRNHRNIIAIEFLFQTAPQTSVSIPFTE